MVKKNVYLITGSEGFIGKNLVSFASDNHYSFYAPKLSELDLLNSLKQNFESRFLYFSTSGIYGLQNDEAYPIKENSSCNLNHLDEKNIYLTSKIFGESTLKFLCKEKISLHAF